jgi:hypothetical protein
MKRYILGTLVVYSTLTKIFAQAPDSTFTEKYLLDFVVPDMPAYKALGTDPSTILRPADSKKFAISLSPFYSNGKAVIPKNFAVEFSPWKLASAKWTLNEYNTNRLKRFLYRSSFSLGTVEDTTKYPNKLSIGYRVSFLSRKADILRTANTALQTILPQMQATNVAFVNLTTYWVTNIVKPDISERPTYYQKNRQKFNEFLSKLSAYLKSNPDATLQSLYDQLLVSMGKTELTNDELKNVVEAFAKGTDAFIEKYKEENWNASRFDLAVAWVGQSNNDQLSNAQFSSFSLWATYAMRAHKNGQLLIGTNLTTPRTVNDKATTKWSVNLRYYAGTQQFRGFFETQYRLEKNQPVEKTLLINLGAELKIGEKFWLSASGGLNNYLAESNPFNKLVSSIDLKYGFNGSNKK